MTIFLSGIAGFGFCLFFFWFFGGKVNSKYELIAVPKQSCRKRRNYMKEWYKKLTED